MMRNKSLLKQFLVIVCTAFFCVSGIPFPAMAQEEEEQEPSLRLNAQSAVLMDGRTGRVLYGKNEETVRPMASTTKIMTCILALEHGNVEDEVTVSSYAAGQPKVHLGAPAGRRFLMGDLLYSLMLESHNDTAVMLAEYVAGDVESFGAMMNDKARELGCGDTWFITPNGLDARGVTADGKERFHSTTARDLARIMSYCTWESPKSREFLEITRTQNYYFTDLDQKGSYSCVNHNAFLSMMEQALSGKTGFTGGAGYSYVASLEDGGRTYVIALLGCGWPPHKTWKWSDARTLFRYGLEEYENRPLGGAPNLKPVAVTDGIPGEGDGEWAARVRLAVGEGHGERQALMREGEQVEVRTEIPGELQAPVYEGDLVGQIVYCLDGVSVCTEPVYAAETVERIGLPWCLRQTVGFFLQ